MAVLETYSKKKKFLSPKAVIEKIGIEPGQTIIDFGCGPGFWAIPMAKKATPGGKVYALDEYESNLEILRSKAQTEGLTNIIYKKVPYASGSIPVSDKADLILISNILSLIGNDEDLIKSTAGSSKKGTKLVVIDWQKNSLVGISDEQKSSEEAIIILAERAGFEFKKLLDAGSNHFGLYFEYEK